MKKPNNEDASLDMTPMIDVVFQLIIFFVVTLKMSDDKDDTIRLADGQHGIILTQDELPPSHLTVDVGYKYNDGTVGRISINNFQLTEQQLAAKIKDRVRKYGTEFPIIIRADSRVQHKYVKKVMDVCTACGVWKLSFQAIQKHKATK